MPFDIPNPSQDNATQTSPLARPQLAEQLAEPESVKPFIFGLESKSQQNLEPTKSHHKIWDFQLPKLDAPSILQATQPANLGRAFFAMMQHGESFEAIQAFHSQMPTLSPSDFNMSIDRFPIMFYAAQTNNEKIIRLIANYGPNLDIVSDEGKIPLLAYVIINGLIIQQDTSAVLNILLSLGATAEVIPKAFYSPYDVDLPTGGPRQDQLTDLQDENKK